MKKLFLILLLCSSFLFANNEDLEQEKNKKVDNIWLKIYSNYKNYNIVLGNIAKVEQELEKIVKKNNIAKIQELNNKILIYKSKLTLYEKSNSFDELLKNYKYEMRSVTIYDFLFSISLEELKAKIIKYEALKREFYEALIFLQNANSNSEELANNLKKMQFLKEELDYFSEYSENIEKMSQNLFEIKTEIEKKYDEYKNEVFIKHLITLSIVFVSYVLYKFLLFAFFYLSRNKENIELEISYRKVLSLLFILSILIFLIIRYINDFIYIITFLGVIAAALTIATRDIILNIAGAIYIFFSNVVRVGNRVMVQFETKHTVGDIVDISFVKMKLNEVVDYTNIKDIKNVGRTIYIPNSYIFTKVFYNYSLKKNGIINDLIEFEFDVNNDFDFLQTVTKEVFEKFSLPFNMIFSLNSSKTGISALISYEVNYKIASQKRGEISIFLLKEYTNNELIKLKTSTKSAKKDDEE